MLHPVLLQSFFSDLSGCFAQADFVQQVFCFATGVMPVYGWRMKAAKAKANMAENIFTIQI